jgi:Fur family peroxide stress response transcriptional regulator
MAVRSDFRELCHARGLAATRQRQIIYETVLTTPGHPSPEAIFERVQKKIPSISLATVYNNLHTFLESEMLQEVSLHQKSLRIETNLHPHHHLICVNCKSITDLDERQLQPLKFRKKPQGFQIKRVSVDILGLCSMCSTKSDRRKQSLIQKPSF